MVSENCLIVSVSRAQSIETSITRVIVGQYRTSLHYANRSQSIVTSIPQVDSQSIAAASTLLVVLVSRYGATQFGANEGRGQVANLYFSSDYRINTYMILYSET